MSFNPPIPGSTTVIAKLELRNNPDLPVADMQHIEGGAHSVADLATRDAIPQTLRQANITRCYVVATDITYVLRGGVGNVNWIPEVGGGGGVTLEVGNFLPALLATVGEAINVGLPADLFKAFGTRTWTVVSITGLPDGVIYLPSSRSLSNAPTESGRFTVVVNAEDTDGNRAQSVQYLLVRPAPVVGGHTEPSTVVLSGYLPQRPLECRQGQTWAYAINPAILFRSTKKLPVEVLWVDGLPPGLLYSPTQNVISGTPTAAGLFTIIILGTDDYGGFAQYVATLRVYTATDPVVIPPVVVPPVLVPPVIPPPVVVVPTTVGSAAINIITPVVADVSIVLTTPGLIETGAEAFATANYNLRYIGGTDVDNALALGSHGYTTVAGNGGIGYYSFAFNIARFRTKYPALTQVKFDVYVDPAATTPAYINQVNYSYHLSTGLEKVTLANGFDYRYKDLVTSATVAGFWRYSRGSQAAQQNQTYDLHEAFTILNNDRKRIGSVRINLISGVSRFEPVGYETEVVVPPVVPPAPTTTYYSAGQAVTVGVETTGTPQATTYYSAGQAVTVSQTDLVSPPPIPYYSAGQAVTVGVEEASGTTPWVEDNDEGESVLSNEAATPPPSETTTDQTEATDSSMFESASGNDGGTI